VFLLGHTGIGLSLGRRALGPAAEGRWRWILLGTLLPDLIDKPLYYGLVAATGRHGAELGLVSSTRTIGHTAILGLLLYGALRLSGRGPMGLALLAGLATHWLLDLLGDPIGAALVELGWTEALPGPRGPPTLAAILFPLLGPRFPVMPFPTLRDHLLSLRSAYTIAGEVLGATLLWRLRRDHSAKERWMQSSMARPSK
jgi:hypothetical protein